MSKVRLNKLWGDFYAIAPNMGHIDFPIGTKVEITSAKAVTRLHASDHHTMDDPSGKDAYVTFKILSVPDPLPEREIITVDRKHADKGLTVRVPIGTIVESY